MKCLFNHLEGIFISDDLKTNLKKIIFIFFIFPINKDKNNIPVSHLEYLSLHIGNETGIPRTFKKQTKNNKVINANNIFTLLYNIK